MWWCGYGAPVRLSGPVGEADEPVVAVGTELERLKNGVRSMESWLLHIDNNCGAIASSRNAQKVLFVRQLATLPVPSRSLSQPLNSSVYSSPASIKFHQLGLQI